MKNKNKNIVKSLFPDLGDDKLNLKRELVLYKSCVLRENLARNIFKISNWVQCMSLYPYVNKGILYKLLIKDIFLIWGIYIRRFIYGIKRF